MPRWVAPAWSTTAFVTEREPRVIIVGAGVAGITTAHVLRERGFTDITVLGSPDPAAFHLS